MISKRRQLLSLFCLFALVATGLAQQPQQTTSVNRLRQAVEYLASDALEGRRTGTPGANGAAHYIAGEFSLLGLRPGMEIARPARTRGESRSRYLQSFPYVSAVALGPNNLLSLNPQADSTTPISVGQDWVPLGFSSNGLLKSAEMVFAGYGISSAELKYNDYANANASDRVAIVFAGTPDGDNPHGQFTQAGQIRFKVAAARAAGARALLIITNEDKLKDDRLARLSYDNAGEAGIPVIVISRKLAARVLGAAEANLAEFTKVADARTSAGAPLREPIKGRTLGLDVSVNRGESPSSNIIGILPGSDPKLKDEAIILGAHYDHLGRGGEGSLAPREGEIHHGADDNASGTAALIELARRLSTQRPRPRRTIVFIAFSGEEEGLLGSNYYVNHPVVPLANTIAMINMDMIGRLQAQKLIIGGIGTAPEWRAMVEGQNSPANMATAAINEGFNSPDYSKLRVNLDPKISPVGYPIILGANGRPVVTAEASSSPFEAATPFTLTLNEDGFGPSDHSSFYGKQIPVLFFWTGTHNDYHKPSDTSDKINYEGEAKIVSFIERIIRDLDKSDKRPTYAVAKSESQGRSGGFRVYLGTIPNYADSNDGLLLDGVRDASPAAKAGMKAGDKIVKIAGHDVKNVYDYTYALGEMKGGQEYEIEVVRGAERLKLKITPESRK